MERLGKALVGLGILLLCATVLLAVYNLYDTTRAGTTAQTAVQQLEASLPEPVAAKSRMETGGAEANAEAQQGVLPQVTTAEAEEPEDEDLAPEQPELYELNPQISMPTTVIDGWEYIGVLEIPALGLELPVLSQWSYAGLRIAPCRYQGSAYLDDLVIAAHNYQTHFGRIKELQPGDEVRFTDAEGHVFLYEVLEIEILQPTAIEEMTTGDWDLTLFTCTIGGQSRVTLRCGRQSA